MLPARCFNVEMCPWLVLRIAKSSIGLRRRGFLYCFADMQVCAKLEGAGAKSVEAAHA